MKPYDYMLYGLVIFGWSTSWLPLKWQLGIVSPEISLFYRFVIATVVMFCITAMSRHPILIPWREHPRIMAMGFFLFSTNFTLFYYGGISVTSALLAVVFSLASLINIILTAIITQTRPKLMMVFAALLGFVGVGLIYSPELQLSTTGFVSLGLCIIGTCVFCIGNMVSRSVQQRGVPVMTANCWGMFYGVIILAFYSFVQGHEYKVEWTAMYLGGLVWLALMSSVLAFTAYLGLLGRIGAERAGYATVIFPIGALLISTVMEGYEWSLIVFIGLVFVLLGNVLILRKH